MKEQMQILRKIKNSVQTCKLIGPFFVASVIVMIAIILGGFS
jgi:hypothetical protein